MNKKIIIAIAVAAIALGVTYYFIRNNGSSETYEIEVNLVDDRSPDRTLKVLKNGKETKNYKHIKLNDKRNIILCYQKNPTVNVFELESDELIIVLSDDKEVIAKLTRKDKEK